jgi:UDP-N-acetylglucosamine--N-acetylmuramyl-(pentapeptide) pyrophosphoryl-undecaprenol N-acetylglucosamine transferase
VAEDHQTQNAMALVNHNAAVLVKDTDAIQKLGDIAIELLSNTNKLDNLERNIAHLAMHNSAEIIASEVLKLVKN